MLEDVGTFVYSLWVDTFCHIPRRLGCICSPKISPAHNLEPLHSCSHRTWRKGWAMLCKWLRIPAG